jgi:hypothetical protein
MNYRLWTNGFDTYRQRVTKTAEEWIRDNGPGLLCSTEY